MSKATIELVPVYSQIIDSYGDIAKVYFMDDGNHKIDYYNNQEIRFWEEEFKLPIEEVEQLVIDWAKGKRELYSKEQRT